MAQFSNHVFTRAIEKLAMTVLHLLMKGHWYIVFSMTSLQPTLQCRIFALHLQSTVGSLSHALQTGLAFVWDMAGYRFAYHELPLTELNHISPLNLFFQAGLS